MRDNSTTTDSTAAICWGINLHDVRSVSIHDGDMRAYVAVSEYVPIVGVQWPLFTFRIVAIVPDSRSFRQCVDYVSTNNYNDVKIDQIARMLANRIANAERAVKRASTNAHNRLLQRAARLAYAGLAPAEDTILDMADRDRVHRDIALTNEIHDLRGIRD